MGVAEGLAEAAGAAGIEGAALCLRCGEETELWCTGTHGGKPVGPDVPLPVMSLAKLLTAMLLVEQAGMAKVELSTPVAELLPSFELERTSVSDGYRSLGPAGWGVTSTAVDLCHLGIAASRGDWAALREEQVTMPGPHEAAWCRGWARYDWETPTFGWDGVGTGARSFLRVLPELEVSVALITNGDAGRSVYREVERALVEERLGVSVSPDRFEPADGEVSDDVPTGRFANGPVEIELARRDSALHLSAPAAGLETDLLSVGGRVFTMASEVDYPTVLVEPEFVSAYCFGFAPAA